MALFRYFKREKGNLPDPHGPLARSVPSTSIAAANSEVSTAIDTASRNSGKRGHYEKYTPQQKAMIGKTAAEHASVRIPRARAQNGCGFNANRAPRNFFHEIAKITTFTKILPLEKYPLYGIYN